MTVAGYEIGRDERRLTNREREVLDLMKDGLSFKDIGERIGVTKQRVGQIAQSLAKKGVLVHDKNGYGLPLKTGMRRLK